MLLVNVIDTSLLQKENEKKKGGRERGEREWGARVFWLFAQALCIRRACARQNDRQLRRE